MRFLFTLALLGSVTFLGSTAFAQFADPFGGADDDPFAESSTPSVGDAEADPFAAQPPQARRPGVRPANRVAAPKPRAPKTAVASHEANARIDASLSDETTQTFIELPLEDAVRQLSESHDIPIVVDRRALEEIGLAPDAPVTLSLKNVSLRSFLRLMLRGLDLSYVIRDEVMIITTAEAAESMLRLKGYQFPSSLTERGDKIVTALQTVVEPAQWDAMGGTCTVAVVENVLMVSATESVHAGVLDFLVKLERELQRRTSSGLAR